jgi:Uma2 family endonuclease
VTAPGAAPSPRASRIPPPGTPMTVEEFLALPDDGVVRELVRGELREVGPRVRGRPHWRAEARLAGLLDHWLDQQPLPRGQILSGQVAFRLAGAEESVIEVDVAYISAERAAATGPRDAVIGGPPVLAAVILAPSDALGRIVDVVQGLLEVGAVVWEVDPDFRRVIVYRPDRGPELFNIQQELSGEPYLPGFRVAVAKIFE